MDRLTDLKYSKAALLKVDTHDNTMRHLQIQMSLNK